MPELPEVETVVRGLRPKLEGRVLAEVEQRCASLRFPLPADFAGRLRGRPPPGGGAMVPRCRRRPIASRR